MSSQLKREDKPRSLFGLELLESLEENSIQQDYERNIVLFHWFLISNGYGCIGKGDAKEISGDEVPTELLPVGWNLTNETDIILLRYIKAKKLYLARITKLTDDLIFNLIRAEDMKITSCIVSILHVPDEYEHKVDMIERFEQNILDFGCALDEKPKNPQNAPNPIPNPSRFFCLQQNMLNPPFPNQYLPLQPGNPGRADLDPFGVGGGNLMLPAHRRIPLPPRIRIDPVGPLAGMGMGMPNPDHMRPPQYHLNYDDDIM